MQKSAIVCVLLTTLLIVLTGCESPPAPASKNIPSPATVERPRGPAIAPPPAPSSADLPAAGEIHAKPLLSGSIPAYPVDMPSDVLPFWRQYRERRPTLVIFSPDPMLMAIDPAVQAQIQALIKSGTPRDFLGRGRVQSVDPLILPEQTLTAALDSGFFSRIVWILPPPQDGQEIPTEKFRQQLIDRGILTRDEASALVFTDGIYRGTLKTLPFTAVTAGPLPKLEEPIVLHFDGSFLTAQYQNEIKTPLFSLVQGTLVALRQTDWSTLGVTITTATEEGSFPLELRFIKNLLTETLADPERLDKDLPEDWELRREALYLETFFQPEAILDHYLRMEQLRPLDASVKFDIYRALVMVKERDDALLSLDKAIRLDKGYAREYINLATAALTKERYQEALAHLRKAQKLLPGNPFIGMESVKVMRLLGKQEEADKELRRLRALPWSPIYYPNIQIALDGLENRR